MKLNQIQPTTPHIEGFVRFASETDGVEQRQLDHFEVLARHHNGDGGSGHPALAQHEIMGALLPPEEKGKAKLRTIPIKLICDAPENSLTARYEAFDTVVNRMTCAGDGEKGNRAELTTGRIEQVSCAGPESCEYANRMGIQCGLRVRLLMQIEGQKDAFSLFEFQSGSINTFRTLSAKLRMMYASFGRRLRHIPLELAMFTKSSAASNYMPFYVADLRLREGMQPVKALAIAKAQSEQAEAGALDYAAMEAEIEKMRSDSAWALGDTDADCPIFSYDRVDRQKLKTRETRTNIATAGHTAIQAVIAKARAVAPDVEAVHTPEAQQDKAETAPSQVIAAEPRNVTTALQASAIEVPSLPL